jgi:uncharacterized membrane protein
MSFFTPLVGNGVAVAVLGHGMIGVSLIWDKVLLKRPATKNLLSYVFWLGAISVFGLILIPFGFKLPALKVAGMAFASGVLDLAATYFYYSALKAGEASEELAAMGGFSPVATALIALFLLKQPLGGQLTGFVLMTLGGFVMFGAEKRPLKKMLQKILLASGGFGLMSVLQKMVYNQTNFVTGFVSSDPWLYWRPRPGAGRFSSIPNKRRRRANSGTWSTGSRRESDRFWSCSP